MEVDHPVSFRLNILLDADALVAAAREEDSNHKKAAALFLSLRKRGAYFYVSLFTIPEAATVISNKMSQTDAKKFLRGARDANFGLIELSPSERDLADDWFLKQTKKGTSYFDCYNMAVLQSFEFLDGIFSFDAVYKRNGFRTADSPEL